ncbi:MULTISPECIES: extracellular solute-binding protein [unclassified Paenibacillus]|uniref:ABC transporter substrate-binding protein n=1 Tax=unclassified Paenibacillus TaxID=185978 RepID=UPI001AE3A535|nr:MULTISPECIES: extracellular solute-binding protein [unclassified Paenibacillus]MBP1154286.1 iron(III) transport system substrate-binding protein [Paenibacillus sp. PvP091]MBP1170329.1 iron(III) transport system substrate-binding protein [Paenibacillus sp. PvR098]MBP2441357.1 iron(III) transport system substrate-binding protein [Paenibacillus sp. PvP052]
MLSKAWGRRKGAFFTAVLGCLIAASTACGGQTAAPKTNPNDPQNTNATLLGSTSTDSGWEQIVNEAKKEGKVVLSGSPSPLWKKSLVDAFEAEYPGIKVEYTGANSRDFWPRVKKEQELGQYLWDLRAGGVSGDAYESKRAGLFDPIRPLIQPENTKDSVWFGGFNGAFVDKEGQYFLSYLAFAEPTTFVNRDFISEAELSSSSQLLDPKFKGKISIQDLRGGAGQSSAAALMNMYGEDFIVNLLTNQGLAITSDNRQQAEWLVRGNYPITIGFNAPELAPFAAQGLGKNIVTLKDDMPPQGTGFGALQLLKNAPHPNAAKVYVNWLLTHQAQQQLVNAVKLNSRRLEVQPGDPTTVLDMQNKDKYFVHSREEYVDLKLRIIELANKLLKK